MPDLNLCYNSMQNSMIAPMGNLEINRINDMFTKSGTTDHYYLSVSLIGSEKSQF